MILTTSTAGLIAYDDLSSSVDPSSMDSITLWIKSATSTTSGDLEIIVDETEDCTSSLENIDLPALATSTWKLITLSISDNSDMTAMQCVGPNMAVDNGPQLINLDNVHGQGQGTSLLIILTNSLGDEPVDVTEPGDSDDNGVADSDSIHAMILTYSDKNQHVKDVYWTKTFVGNNESDDLLGAGEKVEMNVRLKGLANINPLVGDIKFQIEFRPEDGGVMVIERTMPDNIDAVMSLNKWLPKSRS